jgi:hypothetical protein
MLWGVPRRVQRRGGYVPERQDIIVLDGVERERHLRTGRKDIGSPRCFRELAACGEVVGVDVRVDHELNVHPVFLGGTQIRFDVADGIDDGPARFAAAAE